MLDRNKLAGCPLCQTPLLPGAYRVISGYEKDHLVSCRACGFHFSLLDPNAEDYARVYGAYDYAAEDDDRTPASIAKERRTSERLAAYRKTGRVLDIAAGAGRFLQHFADLGFDCYATEFNDDMCRYLEAKGFTALPGGIRPQGAEAGSFDVIIFTEIIEHINDPMPILANIARLLRPGGCLYLTTPNFASLERRMIGPSWGMLMWPEHITYWTPGHLDRALRAVGLRKASLYTQNISPYRVVQALKRGRFSKALGNVSEQAVSDAAQAQVEGSRMLSAAKGMINAGLRVTGLGSSIQAYYTRA